jgi:hypothetical protein
MGWGHGYFTAKRAHLVLALILVSGVLVPGPLAAAAAERTVAPSAGAASSASGHYHPLAGPKRIASSLTGSGFAAASLAAGASRVIHVAGHGGIPSSNVLAVAVTLTAVKPAGATDLSAGPGPDKPAVPSLVSAGGTTSAFAIVPVLASDSIQVWNGAAATDVTIDVVGWFAAGGDSGTSGLMTRLAARKVGSATLAPGATKKLTIAGKEDVPAANVGAMLLRLRSAGARKPGTLALASSSKKLGTAIAFVYPKGAGQDLALPKLSNAGSVVLKNRGRKKVKVIVDAVSSFSNGGDPEAFGDTLNVVSPLQVATAHPVSRTTPFVTAVAGIGDIPPEVSAVPPSMILLRGLAKAPTAAGILSVVAEHAIPGVPSLRLKASKPSAGLVPAQPSSESNSSFVTSKGTTQVSAEAYGYFAGGTVMNPNFRTLSAADLAAIQSDPPPDSVTFSSPVPADLNDLAVDDIISAGASDHTPTGFLRKVTAIDSSGSDLVVQTEDAGLADAVEHAQLSWGTGVKPAAASQTQSVKASPRRTAPRASAAADPAGPSCEPDLFWVGASIGCTLHTMDNGASIDISNTFRLDWQGSIDVGLTGTHMTSAITVSDTLSGEVSAGAGPSDLEYTKTIFQKFLQCPQSTSIPVTFCSISPFPPIGPLDLWITPVLSLDFTVSGHIDGGLSATGSITDSATANFDSDSGSGLQFNQPSFEGNLTHGLTKADADVKFAAVPSANFYLTFAPVTNLYRDQLLDGTLPSTKLTGALPLYLRFTADYCALKGFVGLDLSLSLALKAFGLTVADLSWSHNLAQKEIFDHPWHNCAYWSGTITVKENLFYDNGLTAEQGHYKAVENGSSFVTIHAPKDKEPPEDGFYYEKGQGSGLRTEKQWLSCSDSGGPHYFPYTTKTRWAGALTNQGLKGIFYFDLRDDTHRHYTLTGPNPGSFGADWERTTTYLAQDFYGNCTQQEVHDQGKYYAADVWSLIDNGASSSRISFDVNASGAAGKTLHIEGASNEPKWTVVYDLQKHCTKGGYKC